MSKFNSTLTSALVTSMLTALTLWLSACGGGSGSAVPLEGSLETRSIVSAHTGSDYALSIYLPAASVGARSSLPVLYVLDGESWFETLVRLVEAQQLRVIVVAIHTAGLRARDFVPPNACTPNGGGHAAYFNFIQHELVPYVERTIGGDPRQRALFGHSHGGSLVLYAMFAQAPAAHTFKTYLASDSSVSCMSAEAHAWAQRYAAAHRVLPVRLHFSYARLGNYAANLAYADALAQHHYGQLSWRAQAYEGSHGGIVPQVLADGLAFVLAGSAAGVSSGLSAGGASNASSSPP